MQLNVINILKEQNKSKYWLFNELNNIKPISYANFNALVCNKTKSIKYQTLENLCNILNCIPNDLLQ
ncbi:MAG: helix-turn-helix domain-containing protein [Clostridia bacterium]